MTPTTSPVHSASQGFLRRLLFLGFALLVAQATGQPTLEKKVSLRLERQSLHRALSQLSQDEGIKISYDPRIMEGVKIERQQFSETPVGQVLTSLLGPEYTVSNVGDHIIIRQAALEPKKEKAIPRKKPNYPLLTAVASDEGLTMAPSPAIPVPSFAIAGEHEQQEPQLTPVPATSQDTTKVQKDSAVFQLSLLPRISTVGKRSDQLKINNSINVFGGHIRALQGFELGMVNVIREDMRGAQLGLSNYVGRDVQGFQFSPLVNWGRGSLDGMQLSGAGNLNKDGGAGVQWSMGFNGSGPLRGWQMALVFNYAADTLKGVQAALGANVTEDLEGVQVAAVNVATKNVAGLQIGAVNYAGALSGVQFGFVNVADSLQSGVAIGLLNFIKGGRLDLSLEYNDVEHARFAFRTGTRSLYFNYSAGLRALSDSDEFLWTYGGAVGGEVIRKGRFTTAIEGGSTMVHNSERKGVSLNLLNRFNVYVGWRLTDWLLVTGGPSLNVFVTDEFDTETNRPTDFPDKSAFLRTTAGSTHISMWVGYSLSLTFF